MGRRALWQPCPWRHLRHRPCRVGLLLSVEAQHAAHRCHLHHHSRRDVRRHVAGLRRYGLDDTDSREDTSQASRPHHPAGSLYHVFSHHTRRDRPRGLYAYAHHLRHCAEKRHPSGASLRHSKHRVTNRHHVLAHRSSRRSILRHLGRLRFPRDQRAGNHGHHSRLHLRHFSCCRLQLEPGARPRQRPEVSGQAQGPSTAFIYMVETAPPSARKSARRASALSIFFLLRWASSLSYPSVLCSVSTCCRASTSCRP